MGRTVGEGMNKNKVKITYVYENATDIHYFMC